MPKTCLLKLFLATGILLLWFGAMVYRYLDCPEGVEAPGPHTTVPKETACLSKEYGATP